MQEEIKVSEAREYSNGMDNYSNDLSLNGISGPGRVADYVSSLSKGLQALQISIAYYTSHINNSMDELIEIDDTIAKNFASDLSNSAFANNYLSNNFSVTVNGEFYGFDAGDSNKTRIISAVIKMMDNKKNNKNIYDGLTEKEKELIVSVDYKELDDYVKSDDNLDSLLTDNAHLNKESRSIDELVELSNYLKNNEYIESDARRFLRDKGLNSEDIEFVINYKNINAIPGYGMSETEYDNNLKDVYYRMNPDKKPPEITVPSGGDQTVKKVKTVSDDSSYKDGMPSNINNNGGGGNSGDGNATSVPPAGEQNEIDFSKVDLADHNFHLAPDELNLENANNKVYIQLDSNATLDEISKAYGGIPYKYIKRYYPETGQTDVISDPQMVFKDAYYVIDVSDIQ